MANQGRKVFDEPESVIIEGAACTWCGAQVGEPCEGRDVGHVGGTDVSHAQRWYDYWNATHDRSSWIEVYHRGGQHPVR